MSDDHCRKPNTPRWKVSKIPPGLVSLTAYYDSLTLSIDAPLPSTLETCDCYSAFWPNDTPKVHPLSQKFKMVPRALLPAGMGLESILTMFPNLEEASIYRESSVALLPKTLKSLWCKETFLINCALPSGLNDLTLGITCPSEAVKHIPTNLTSLNIHHTLEEWKPQPAAPFAAWTKPDFDHVASRIQLVTLKIDWRQIADSSSLVPLARMKTLKKIEYRQNPSLTLQNGFQNVFLLILQSLTL